jgi:hypothetical protein
MMQHHFSKHYSLEDARKLLPQIRQWLTDLDALQEQLEPLNKRIASMMGIGDDVGGDTVNTQVKTVAACKNILNEFRRREIQIKDFSRGLVDFPSLRDGREVFLCWEKDEDDIEFWHDLDSGFAGREKI